MHPQQWTKKKSAFVPRLYLSWHRTNTVSPDSGRELFRSASPNYRRSKSFYRIRPCWLSLFSALCCSNRTRTCSRARALPRCLSVPINPCWSKPLKKIFFYFLSICYRCTRSWPSPITFLYNPLRVATSILSVPVSVQNKFLEIQSTARPSANRTSVIIMSSCWVWLPVSLARLIPLFCKKGKVSNQSRLSGDQ